MPRRADDVLYELVRGREASQNPAAALLEVFLDVAFEFVSLAARDSRRSADLAVE
jgi:hypothetical protein